MAVEFRKRGLNVEKRQPPEPIGGPLAFPDAAMPTHLETLSEIHKAEAEAEVLRLQATRDRLSILQKHADAQQLHESCDWASRDPFQGGRALPTGLGSQSNDLFHYPAISFHNARPGSRRDGAQPPYFRTEQQHWLMVDAARTLEALCPTATNILDVLTQFAIFTGFCYTIVEKKKPGESTPASNPVDEDGEESGVAPGEPQQPKSNPTVDKAQELLDRWMKDVDWHSWEKELFRRTRLDGEAFLVLEPDDETELLGLRSVEPEQVREPHGAAGSINNQLGITGADASWRFGILTTKRDTSKPLAYNVTSQFSDTQQLNEIFDADEVFHLKINVPRNTKRGVSDFFQVMNDIPDTKKLLRNLRQGAQEQATIAYILEQAAGMDGLPSPMTGSGKSRTGRVVSQKVSDGVEVIATSTGVKYHEAPIGQSETLIAVLQAALRNIGARWQFPEGLVSGDASNANLASALVAEAPFVRAMESRQWLYRNAYIRLIERVLDQAAIDGLLPEGENLLDKIEVTCEMPPVVPRKALDETQKNEILSKNHILGNATWSAREDLDREEELADMEADPIQSETIMLGMETGEAEDDTAKEGSPSNEGERVS